MLLCCFLFGDLSTIPSRWMKLHQSRFNFEKTKKRKPFFFYQISAVNKDPSAKKINLDSWVLEKLNKERK